jgi:hypothetical protein
MDQAPRSAFLSVVVLAEERTAVMGVVNILKTLSQSGGPWLTGLLADNNRFWVAFAVAGSLKGAYDILLLVFFAGRVHQRGADATAATSGPAVQDPIDDGHADNPRIDPTDRRILEDESESACDSSLEIPSSSSASRALTS